MYTPEEHFVMNLADIYSLLFGYIEYGLKAARRAPQFSKR